MTCTVCGMPATTGWVARSASPILLCDAHLERHRPALKHAEYSQVEMSDPRLKA